ncbi:hypothetical protein QEN19_001977 [Hanseniaspora menglaensis]
MSSNETQKIEQHISSYKSNTSTHDDQFKELKEAIGGGGVEKLFGLQGVVDPFSTEPDDISKNRIDSYSGSNIDALNKYRQKIDALMESCAGMEDYNVEEGEFELGFDNPSNLINETDIMPIGLSQGIGMILKRNTRLQQPTQNILLPVDEDDENGNIFYKKNDVSFQAASNLNLPNSISFLPSKFPIRKADSALKRKRTIVKDTKEQNNGIQSPSKKQRTLDFYSPKKKQENDRQNDDYRSKNNVMCEEIDNFEHDSHDAKISWNMTQETQPLVNLENKENKDIVKQIIIMSPDASIDLETRDNISLSKTIEEYKNEGYVSIIEGEIIRSEKESDEEIVYGSGLSFLKDLNQPLLKTTHDASDILLSNKSDDENVIVLALYDYSLLWYPAVMAKKFLSGNKEEVTVTSLDKKSTWNCKSKDILRFDFPIGSTVTFENKKYVIKDKKRSLSSGNQFEASTYIPDDTHVLIENKIKTHLAWVPVEKLALSAENFSENEINLVANRPLFSQNDRKFVNTAFQIEKNKLFEGLVVSFSGMSRDLMNEYKRKTIVHGGKYLEKEVYDLISESNLDSGLSFKKKKKKEKYITRQHEINLDSTLSYLGQIRRSPRKKNSVNYTSDLSDHDLENQLTDDDFFDESLLSENQFVLPILLIDSEKLCLKKTTPKVLQYLCLGWPILHYKFIDYLINEKISLSIELKVNSSKSFVDKCSFLNNIINKYKCNLSSNGFPIERDILRYILTVCDASNNKDNAILKTTQDSLRFSKIKESLILKSNNFNNVKITDKNFKSMIEISKALMQFPKESKFNIDIETLKSIIWTKNSLYC